MECLSNKALFSAVRCLTPGARCFLGFGSWLRSRSLLSNVTAINFCHLRSGKVQIFQAASCWARFSGNVLQVLAFPSFKFWDNRSSNGTVVCRPTMGCSRRVFAAEALRGWFPVRAAKPPRYTLCCI